jgi:hypothetical protein
MKKIGQGSLFEEPIEAKRWHRVHAAPASARGGCSLDIGPVRWRGEGGTQEEKRELAYRLALCWNLAEGWPTEALEEGILRSVEDALVQLLKLLDERSQEIPDGIQILADRLSRVLKERDLHYDLTDGRPHDCAACLANGDRPMVSSR